jgi:hyperosmotically inducible periplasmic protein
MRNTPWLIGVFAGALALGCRSNDSTDTTRTTSATTTLTPSDQPNDKADLDTTAQIRRDLVSDQSLSVDAKNVRIVTRDGVVLLRGLVKDEAEKVTVENKAAEVPGVKRIENDLDVLESP